MAGRFATGVAGLVPFAAGIAGVPFTTFVAYSVPLIVVWATAVVMLGVLVGNNIDLIDRILSSFGVDRARLGGAGPRGRWGWRRWQARHARRRDVLREPHGVVVRLQVAGPADAEGKPHARADRDRGAAASPSAIAEGHPVGLQRCSTRRTGIPRTPSAAGLRSSRGRAS